MWESSNARVATLPERRLRHDRARRFRCRARLRRSMRVRCVMSRASRLRYVIAALVGSPRTRGNVTQTEAWMREKLCFSRFCRGDTFYIARTRAREKYGDRLSDTWHFLSRDRAPRVHLSLSLLKIKIGTVCIRCVLSRSRLMLAGIIGKCVCAFKMPRKLVRRNTISQQKSLKWSKKNILHRHAGKK